MSKARKLLVADLFCGAGGTTTGARRAIEEIGREVEFVAVNHWPVAIATHTKNHPNVRHYCKDLDTANPCEIVPEGYLDLLLASPECRFHSSAQGGRPLDEQNRASAWHVTRWAERLYIKRIVVENVPRFAKWGPLDRKGRPVKSKEGELFAAWVATLEAIGYRVEWRVLNAADYGTPQSRKRLFIQARRDGRRIVWPTQTHARRGAEQTLHGVLQTWTSARKVIDFEKRGTSVFAKKLSPKTLARIAEGVTRYCKGPVVEPFLVMLRRYAGSLSIDDPLATITTSGNHHVLIEPVLRPFVVPQGGGGIARDVDEPLPTIATDGAIHVVEPFLVAHFGEAPGQRPRTHAVDDPLPTVTHRGAGDLVQPVFEPYLVESNHSGERACRSIDEPLPVITRKNGVGLVEPMIVEIGGVPYVLDLLHRMLDVDELGRGQDFDDYIFTGTRADQTAQIGNAVPVRLAKAMTSAALHDLAITARDLVA